jgi:hypothetical protein
MSFAPRARGTLLSLQANEQGCSHAANRKLAPRVATDENIVAFWKSSARNLPLSFDERMQQIRIERRSLRTAAAAVAGWSC